MAYPSVIYAINRLSPSSKRTTIPSAIVNHYHLEDGNTFLWIISNDKNRITIEIQRSDDESRQN